MPHRCLIASAIAFALSATTPRAGAQPLIGTLGAPGLARNGFRVNTATVSVGYSSLVNSLAYSSNSELSGGHGWASVSFGYFHNGPKTTMAIEYTPSYSGAFRYDLHSFNQALHLMFSRRLSAKWRFYFSSSGEDSTVEQFIFKPGVLTQIVNGSGTFDDLVAAAGAGSGDLTLTAPFQAVYGSRVLTVAANSGMIYKPSTRLSMTFNAEVSQSQTHPDQSHSQQYLIPRNRFEQGNLAISYSLSPRTELGAQVLTMRARSSAGEYEISTLDGSFERKLGPQWFVSVGGGVATFTSIGGTKGLPLGVSYVANGTLGRKARAQSWAVTYSRRVGDPYGLAAASTNAFYGTWNWRRPGMNWALYAFGGQQRLSGGYLDRFSLWQGGGGIVRSLSRQTSLRLEYGYLLDSVSPIRQYSGGTGHAGRLTVSWHDFREGAPVL